VSCLATFLFPACQRAADEPTAQPDVAVKASSQTAKPADSVGTGQEIWDVFYLQGAKIGYGRTSQRPVEDGVRKLIETSLLNHLSITRFGQTTEQDFEMTSLETRDGQLVSFTSKVPFGPTPTIVRGEVQGETLLLTTETQGRRETATIPLPAGTRGFRAVEQSLARKPMQPGETRSFDMLTPIVNQVATVELNAVALEKTPVLGIDTQLLRIDTVSKLPGGQAIASTTWADEHGEVIKTLVPALKQESVRATRQLALAPAASGNGLDLGLDLFVKVAPPLVKPHLKREITYRVELEHGDPLKVFATGPTQTVRSLGPHSAEVTVRSLRPSDASPADQASVQPGSEYTAANSVLQLDDPAIQKMAKEAKGDAEKPADVALALERFVHDAVGEKNFSHGFASAAEVAASREGDCTEHAVLLAALARVNGLPSRVAIGLVYVESAAGFGYHMWTEVFLNGQWVPLDAMMAGGGVSAAYLKLNDSSLSGTSAYSSFLSVAEVLGQLKVSVISSK